MKNLINIIVSLLLIIIVQQLSISQNSFVNTPGASSGIATNGEDAKMNLNNGTANVGIPLVTLSDVGNSLPISLSYQTGGISVSQPSTEIGLGWNLNAGGVITREVKGYPDEFKENNTYGFLYNNGDCKEIEYNDYLDKESDIFTYNILGYTGKFFFDADKNIIQVNQSDVIIEKLELVSWVCNTLLSWKIILPNGVIAEFGGFNQGDDSYYDYIIVNDGEEDEFEYINAWHLKKITFVNGREFNFQYTNNNYSDYILDQHNALVKWPSQVVKNPTNAVSLISKMSYISKLISSITSDHFKIIFNHSPRTDLGIKILNAISLPLCITSLEHQTTDGLCIQKIDFVQSYFTSSNEGISYTSGFELDDGAELDGLHDTRRLKLNNVKIKDCTSDEEFIYDLEYEEEELLPRRLSYSQDLWGFANGVMDNKSLLPTIQFESNCFSPIDFSTIDNYWFANRDVSFEHAKTGALKKITFPNGNFNEFVYESNAINQIEHDFQLVKDSGQQYDEAIITNLNLDGDENKFQIHIENMPFNEFSYFKLDLFVKLSTETDYTLIEEFDYPNPYEDFTLVYYTQDLKNQLGFVEGAQYDIKLVSEHDFEQFLNLKYFQSTLIAKNNDVGGLRISKIITPFNEKSYNYNRPAEKQLYSNVSEDKALNFFICKNCPDNLKDKDSNESTTRTGGGSYCTGAQEDFISNVYIPCNVTKVKLDLYVKSTQCNGYDTGVRMSWDGLQPNSESLFNPTNSVIDKSVTLYSTTNTNNSIQPGGFYNFKFEAWPNNRPSQGDAVIILTFEDEEEVPIYVTPSENQSNGHLISVPSYLALYKPPSINADAHIDHECISEDLFQIYSSPSTSIHSLNGGHILYDRITETVNSGEYGYSQYDFFEDKDFLDQIGIKNKLNSVFPLFANFPTVESIYLDPIVGLPKSTKIFDANGNVVVLTESEYESNQEKFANKRKAKIKLCSDFNNNAPYDQDVSTSYALSSFLVSLNKTETTQDGITIVTDYEYRPDRLHKMPIKIKTYNKASTSGQDQTVKNIKYAHDVTDYGYSNVLIAMNIVNLPLIELTNTGYKGGSKTEFSIVPNINDPLSFIVRPKSKFTAYAEGGVTKWKKVEEVISYTDQIHPNEVWSKFKPLNSFNTWEDDLLKAKKYGVRETTYDYDNFRRMYKVTDPLGLKMEIEEYDGFHRVKKKNTDIEDGKIINTSIDYTISKTDDEIVSTTTTYPDTEYDIPPRTVKQKYDERGLLTLEIDEGYMHDGQNLFNYNSYNSLGSIDLNCNIDGCSTTIYSSDIRQRPLITKPKGTDATISTVYGHNEAEINGFNIAELSKITITDENGISSSSYKDYKGNLIQSIDGMGFVTNYKYFPISDLLKEVIPPSSSEGNTALNYTYQYTPDFKLESKTIPGRNPETYTYDPELEIRTHTTLHNGDEIEVVHHPEYLDFTKEVKLNGSIIKSFTPYHTDYLTSWVEAEDTRILGTSEFLTTTFDYDILGRPELTTREYIDGGQDELVSKYDPMGNLRELTTSHSGNDVYTTTDYFDYDRGLRIEKSRASLPINGENKEITIHENTYDGREHIRQVLVNDGLHINKYEYHKRGYLKKINSIESTYDPIDDSCDDNDPPPFIPGCEGPFAVDDVSIFYDCFQLSTGTPTTVSITIDNSITDNNGNTQDLGSNTYSFGFNGGGLNESLDNPTTIQNSTSNNSSGSINEWIMSIIQQCLHEASDPQISILNTIALESIILELGGDTPIDPEGPGDPTDGEDDPPEISNSIFGLQIHYEDGNADLGSVGYKNGNISWIEWKAKGEVYQAYGYSYDNNYRLLGAKYNVNDPGDCFGIPKDAYNTSYSYDARGNILSIKRDGVKAISSEGVYEYGEIDNLTFGAYNGNEISTISESASAEKGYRSTGGAYSFVNGNLESDPNISQVTYNHLDLPTYIKSGEGNITITYDADGNKLKQIEIGNDAVEKKTVYMGAMEYVDNARSSLYHEGGRIMYNVNLPDEANEGARDYEEWSISDHLGNTRVRYIDKNDDSGISINRYDEDENEITGTYHYYPFGMMMEGNFYGEQGVEENYQYNGIEHTSVLGPTIGLTMYRVHDAAIGKWWQVDPKAEAMKRLSPFNAMGNNPITMSDPNGDLPFLAVLGIGAATGIFSNGLSNVSQGQGFFDGAGKAALWGGIGAAASFGIGSAFGATGSLGKELGRAGAHALSNGIQSGLQGGSFGQGLLSGGISSGVSSFYGGYGSSGGQIFAGGLGGGIGSLIGGGNFFEGFGQGIAVAAFNHALHSAFQGGPGDPPSKQQVKEYLAGEYLDGSITRHEYINAITLVDDGTWGLIKQVAYNNRTDIALTAGGVGLLKILSKVRVIKDGFLISGKQLQLHKHSLNYLKGKGMSGTAKVWHINIGKTHIIFNPRHWGKLTNHWWSPFR